MRRNGEVAVPGSLARVQVSSWMYSQERRRGLEDMLTRTPSTTERRDQFYESFYRAQNVKDRGGTELGTSEDLHEGHRILILSLTERT